MLNEAQAAFLAGELFQFVSESWYCSQVENEPEERCDGLAHGSTAR